MLCYEFLSRIASSVLRVNCYQWGSCGGGPNAFNSPFGHRSRSHNICPLDNHLAGLSISLSSLVLSWVSITIFGCDSNSQPSVLVASTLPLHYQSVFETDFSFNSCLLRLLFPSSQQGITMMTLSPQIIDELQRRNPDWFGEVDGGVLVTKVNRGSPSERFEKFSGDALVGSFAYHKAIPQKRNIFI